MSQSPTPDYRSKNQDIVQHILDILSDNKVTDAAFFFDNPFREVSEEQLPAIKVGLIRSTSERENVKIEYSHKPELVVVYQCQGNEKLSAVLNYFGERIQRFLANYANTQSDDLGLDEMDYKGHELTMTNGATGTGAYILKFEGTYWTEHLAALVDLEEVYVEYKPTTAPEGDDQIYTETITLPTS